MSRIIVNHEVVSSDGKNLLKDKKAIKNNNVIKYYDDGLYVVVKILDDAVILTRENDKMLINLKFKKNKNIVTDYDIKDLRLKVKLETKTKEIIINDTFIYVSYDLFMNGSFSDSFTYKLEWRDL